jgi:predicted nucleic acid-binding protein
MRIAIDSSVLVGLINPLDTWRQQALTLRAAFVAADANLIYFDCVAAEAASAATRRLHEKGRLAEVAALLDRLHAQVPSNALTWILPDTPRLYQAAFDLMRSSSGALNFNDALIALACREREITELASFDPDFDAIPWLHRITDPQDLRG